MSNLKLSVIINAVDRLTQPVRKAVQSTEKMTESVKAQSKQLVQFSKFKGDIDKFKNLRAENRSTADSLVQARQKAAALKLELTNTAKPTQKLRNEFNQARKSVERLEAKHASQRNKLSALKRNLDTAGYSTRQLSLAERELKQQTEKTTQALEKQNSKLKKIQNARSKIKEGLASTTGMVAAGYSAAQVGHVASRMLSSPIKTAAEFEAAMSGVGAVSRANAQQLSQLTATARRLGETTSYSASQAAAGMKYLAMAGFSTNQIMDSLPGVMDMATAGATDLGQASDISSDILSAFGLNASDMTRVADTLTATFTRSNTSLEMLGETMKYVGPVARGAGMGLEETAAMAGLLGNVGIKSSQAGTTLRAMLQRLAAPSGAAASTLQSLGVEVKDLEGNVRSVPTILGELAKATENMGSAERLSVLKTLFDAEAAAGVSELIEQQGSDGVNKFVDVLKGASGEAARVAKQMGDNAAGGFRSFNSAAEGLKISFANLLLPAVKAATRALTNITRKVNRFVEKWPTLSKWIGYGIAAIAGLSFAFSALMSVLAGSIGAMVVTRYGLQALGLSGVFSGTAIKGLAVSLVTMAKRAIVVSLGGLAKLTASLFGLAVRAVPAVIAGLKAMSVALMSNPIGLIIGGIALAAGIIIANWSGIKSWFGGLWDGIKNIFSSGWELIKKGLSFSPLGLLIKAWQPMLNWIKDKAGWIGGVIGGISNFFGGEEKETPASNAIKKAGAPSAATAELMAKPAMASPTQEIVHRLPKAGAAAAATAGLMAKPAMVAPTQEIAHRLPKAGAAAAATAGLMAKPAMVAPTQETANWLPKAGAAAAATAGLMAKPAMVAPTQETANWLPKAGAAAAVTAALMATPAMASPTQEIVHRLPKAGAAAAATAGLMAKPAMVAPTQEIAHRLPKAGAAAAATAGLMAKPAMVAPTQETANWLPKAGAAAAVTAALMATPAMASPTQETANRLPKTGAAAAVTAALMATPAMEAPTPTNIQKTTTIDRIQIYQQPGEDADALTERVMDRIREQNNYQQQGAQHDE